MKYSCLKHTISTCILLIVCVHMSQAQFTLPKILKHPGKIKIQALHQLNTRFRETNISISPDGNSLYFMTGRGGQAWSRKTPSVRWKGHAEFSGDIYHTERRAGKWQYPRPLPATINTNDGEDEPNISPDGQSVYFQSWYRGWERLGGPYYQARRYGNRWMRPKGLGDGINQFFKDRAGRHRAKMYRGANDYATDGATMSADGKTFIVAVGVYNGKMDLYISKKGRYGRWSYLRRLSISTQGNERSPFLAADGKTLFFASDGYGGFGGLEILKTTLNADGSHGKIVNLGAPFNTYLNDYGFVMPASGKDAYFVRQGNIYYADVKNASPQIKPSVTLMITGKVTNTATQRGTSAVITIKDAQTNQVIASARSNSYSGKYTIMLPTDNPNIIQEVSKTNFTGFKKTFQPILHSGLNEIVSNVPLTPNSGGGNNNTTVAGNKKLMILGIVTNKKTKRGMRAIITIRDTRTNQDILTTMSNAITGQYKIELPLSSPNFVQVVTQKKFDSFNKSFSPIIKTGLNQIISNVALTPDAVVLAKKLMIAGTVTNKRTNKGMKAFITIKDSQTNKVIKTVESNATTGDYKIELPVSNPNFVQVVTQTHYDTFNKNFSANVKPGLNQIKSNVALNPIEQLIIAGTVTNKRTRRGMRAVITIKDSKTNQVIKTVESNVLGDYKIELDAGNPNFVQTVTQANFSTFNKRFSPTIKLGLNKIKSDVELTPNTVVVTTKKRDEEAAAETGRK